MKFLTTVLLLVSLLGLAYASGDAPVASLAEVTSSVARNLDTSDTSDTSVAKTPPELCDFKCLKPFLDCIERCGGGDQCSEKCNCDMFRGPRRFRCESHGCIEVLKICPRSTADVASSHDDDDMLWHAGEMDHAASLGDGQDQHEDMNKNNLTDLDISTGRLPVLPDPVMTICMDLLHHCFDMCNTPDACDQACYCYVQKACGRGMPCNCVGHLCPRVLALGNQLEESFSASVKALDAKSASAVEQRAPPINPCVMCTIAINACKARCTSGACEEACACHNKASNFNCGECNVPCGCGDSCLGVLEQGRLEGAF